MGRYDRYILGQLIALFAFFSFVLISVYWINEAVDLFDSLIADGQTLSVFLEFTALTLPQIMMMVLPVAGFVATLYMFNRLIAESELVVLQTAGLSALRLLRPVVVFGLILGLVVAILGNFLAPAARSSFIDRSLEVRQDLSGRVLREGQFLNPAPGLTVYVREITELGEFHDLFLQDRAEAGTEVTYTAARALLVRSEGGLRLVMLNGLSRSLDLATQRLTTIRFEEFTYDLGALMADAGLRGPDLRELPTRVLLEADARMAEEMGLSLAQMRFSGHERIARALFVIFPPVIAAACLMLGRFSRFGVWPQIVLSVALVIPLQMAGNAAETAGLRDVALRFLAYVQPGLAALIAAAVSAAAMMGSPRRRIRPAQGGAAA